MTPTPEPELVASIQPPQSQPCPSPTSRRNSKGSSLASTPSYPHPPPALSAGPSTSQISCGPTKPRPKPNLKAVPIVKKTPSQPTRAIELSNSSEALGTLEDAQDNLELDDFGSEDLESESYDLGDDLVLPDIRDIFNPGSSQRPASPRAAIPVNVLANIPGREPDLESHDLGSDDQESDDQESYDLDDDLVLPDIRDIFNPGSSQCPSSRCPAAIPVNAPAKWNARESEERRWRDRERNDGGEQGSGSQATEVDPIPEHPGHPAPRYTQRFHLAPRSPPAQHFPFRRREGEILDNTYEEPPFSPSLSMLGSLKPPSSSHNIFTGASPPEPLVPENVKITAISSILQVIPEADPSRLKTLVETHLPTYGAEQIIEFVVGHLLDDPGSLSVSKYNLREGGGEGGSSSRKRKASEGGDDDGRGKKARIAYASAERPFTGGPNYRDCAITALQLEFPLIPLPYLKKKLASLNGLYAPTYLQIRDEEERVGKAGGVGRPYKLKKRGYVPPKGKGKAVSDDVFEEERRWLEVSLISGSVPAATSHAGGYVDGVAKACQQ